MAKLPLVSIVDDDESVRIATKSLLSSLGWPVHTFASAEELLNSPRLDDTCCLISDVEMPGMSGIELQSALAARGYSPPTIFITAFPDDRIRARLLEGGAACLLEKPFDEEALLRCLDAALNSDRSAGGVQ